MNRKKLAPNVGAVNGPFIIPRGLRIKHVAQYIGATNWRVEEMLRNGELRFFWVGKALELFPDAITLNILMPGKNGWEILHRLKTTEATVAIPIVIVSGVDDKGRGFALGASEYLVKPVQKEVLLAALKKHLGNAGPYKVLVVDDEDTSLSHEATESAQQRRTIQKPPRRPTLAPAQTELSRVQP